MSDRADEHSVVSSTRTFDRAIAPALVLALTLTAGLAYARLGLESALLGWILWTAIGVTLCTRGLWDDEVAARGNPFRRLGAVIGKWYGWVGLLATTALIAGWLAATPTTWLTGTVYGCVAGVGGLMLFFAGVVRRLGAGVIVTCLAPGWPYLAVLFGFFLFIPTVLTLLTAIGCSIAELRSRRSQRATR